MACQQMKLQRAKIFSQRKLRNFVKEVSGKLWPIEDRQTDSDCVRPGPELEQMWAKTKRFVFNLNSLEALFNFLVQILRDVYADKLAEAGFCIMLWWCSALFIGSQIETHRCC